MKAQDWKNSLRGTTIPRDETPPPRPRPQTKPAPPPVTRRSKTPEPERARRSLSSERQSADRSSPSCTDWGYPSYSSFLSSSRQSNSTQSSFRSSSTSKTSSSMMTGSSSLMNGSFQEEEEDYRPGSLSLEALRTPKISPWDEMGILGLSSKMYSDTSVKQSSFSASSFVRKESISSHAM